MVKVNLLDLFEICENIQYEQVGDGVNYAFKEDGNTLYIYFQGSSQISDWVRNFLFKKRPYKDMKIPYRVHRGFLMAWKEVEDIIIEKITEKVHLTIDNRFDDYKWKNVVVVGYSHGGALAGFCHECVWFWRPDLRENGLQGYGFEAPRFYGGWHVRKELKERWRTFTIIRDNNDIVTHCPPAIFRFCHVSNILKIKGDTKLGPNKWYIPNCVKSHFPEVVEDGLKKLNR